MRVFSGLSNKTSHLLKHTSPSTGWKKDWGENEEIYEDAGWDVDREAEANGVGREDRGAVENENESNSFVWIIVTKQYCSAGPVYATN